MKQHPVSSPPAQSPPPGESDWDPPLLVSPLRQDGLPHLQVSGTFKKYEGFRDAMQSLKQVWGLRRDGSGPTPQEPAETTAFVSNSETRKPYIC